MQDDRKTKTQLVRELRTVRAKQKKLEKSTEKLRQAEEQRRQAKEQYQQLVENINEVIFSLDDGGTITYVSPAVSVLGGYAPPELSGRSFSDLILPEDLKIANSGFRRVIRGELGPSEFRILTKSGNVRWVRSSSRPIVKQGNVVGISGALTDITERKKVEEELRESEERYRLLLENAGLGVAYWGVNGKLLFFNEKALSYMGGRASDYLGRSVCELYGKHVGDVFMDRLRKAAGSEKSEGYEDLVSLPTGERWFHSTYSAVRDVNHGVIGVQVISDDITERKLVEKALLLEKESFRHSLDESPLGIRIVTADGDTLYANRAILDLYGYDSLEELRKTPLRARYTPESYAEFQERNQQRERGDFSTSEYEISIVRKNGEVLHLQVHRKQVRWNNAQQFLVMYQDITEPKKAEEALAESERKLRTLFEILPVGTSIFNAQRKIVYVNAALERILDDSKESLFKVGYGSRTYLRPDGTLMPAEEFASVRAIKEQRAVHNVETGVVKEDGTVIWTTVSAVPLGFSDWEVLVVTSDITERKRAEEALRASEERYRRLFEGDLAGDYVSTPAGKLVACNAAFARIFRFKSIDDALATNTHELYPNPEARQLFLRSLRQDRRLELREAWLKRRDGTDLHVIENSFGVFDDKGELIEIRGYLLDDTERKLAEKALRESEERFRELFNHMSSGVAVYEAVDSGGDFIFRDFNPAAERIEKVSRKDILGKRVTEAFPGVKAFGVFEVFQRVWQTGKPEYLPENIYKDEMDTGSWRENSVFKLPTGEIVAIYNDITERKQVEEALQKSEERYRSLFANMLDGFAYCKMIYDDHDRPVDFVYLAVNSAFEKLTGLKDVVGKRVLEVIPDIKDSSPELFERYGRVALTGKPEQFEFDFKSLTQRLSISVYSTEKGYFVAVFENITERKQAEEALLASEKNYRDLFENSMVGISQTMPDGRLFRVNRVYAQMYGYGSPEEMIAEVTDVGHQLYKYPEERDFVRWVLATKGEMEPREFTVLRRDGTRFSVLVAAREVKGQSGALAYYQHTHIDITERKKAEESLRTAQEQLHRLAGHLQSVREEERKHLSQEFHDQLGQTLSALKMDMALLQRELADKTKEISRISLTESIRSMYGLIDSGIQMIREIMSELHPELLDQLGLVAALEWEAERFQKRSGLKCQFTSELGEFQNDPKKSIALFRIFQEAVTNVARHAHATIVEIIVRREGDDVVLEIKDDGIGIEPNAEHKAGSFGLIGMRERAILLGGKVEITSIKGRGTTVLVRMPYEQTLPDGGTAL